MENIVRKMTSIFSLSLNVSKSLPLKGCLNKGLDGKGYVPNWYSWDKLTYSLTKCSLIFYSLKHYFGVEEHVNCLLWGLNTQFLLSSSKLSVCQPLKQNNDS